MRDAPLTACPKCGQDTARRRVGRGAGIIFKGSGFYETDYKRPPAKTDGAETKAGDSSTPAAASSGATSAPASTETSSSPAATSPAKSD